MSVNAPDSGTIKEFLVKEEDTVTVGQDIIKLELGSADGKKAGEPSKEPPSFETTPSSKPEQQKTQAEVAQPPSKEEPPSPPKPEPVPQKQARPQPSKEPQPQPGGQTTLGNREERRVCHFDPFLIFMIQFVNIIIDI